MADARWGAGSPLAERIAAGSGLGFAVLAAIGFLVLGQPAADATGDEIVSYFADKESQAEWQALLFGVAAALFLWFVGSLAAALRRAEDDPAGRIPAIVVATGAASAAIYLAGEAAWVALARTAGEEGTTRTLFDLGQAAFSLSAFTVAAFTGAAAVGIMRTRLLPDWVGWLALGMTALLVLNGIVQVLSESGDSATQMLASITFFAFLVWVAVTSVMWTLALREPRAQAARAT